MKPIRIFTIVATTLFAASTQHATADKIKLAKLEGLKSSLHLQFKAEIKIEGIKLEDGTKVIFQSDSIITLPSVLMRNGEKGVIEIIKEYEAGDVDDRPFEGLKFTLLPRFDFITGKVTNSGKMIISQATRIGDGKIENNVVNVSHDFKSWSKHWNAVGDQNLTLKVDETNSIKIHVTWTALAPSGKALNIKQGEGAAPNP